MDVVMAEPLSQDTGIRYQSVALEFSIRA